MLQLKNICKDYEAGDSVVHALKGLNLEFRESEFVSILGPSGCGKTTLLNIIGGLDRYTSGDLVIAGRSTKEYRDRDWDSYRNHSIGFVFQSYNLIPHQSVLANVELALTLSGVNKRERRKRAKAVLEQVGLGDQLNKKPNQMSGGQMQRVAIARALVNNPEILLADEPTGALDTETSKQIMDILKEISTDRLIIMVTHNPDLAETYSTRIIRLLDGEVISDSNPYCELTDRALMTEGDAGETVAKVLKKHDAAARESAKKTKKTSMSFFTALSLSFKNLLTKKARTLLTAFAGSIGIIGIALILSLSDGAQKYINKVQSDTLSSYPLTIEKSTVDMSSLITTAMGTAETVEAAEHEEGYIYSTNIMSEMMHSMLAEVKTNNLESFKKWLDSPDCPADETVLSAIRYNYSTTMNIYNLNAVGGTLKVNPSSLTASMGMGSSMAAMYSGTSVWSELLDNDKLIREQYDAIAGRFPERYDEIVLIVSDENTITDYMLYSLGILDPNDLAEMFKNGGELPEGHEVITSYSYDNLLDLEFKLLINTDYFQEQPDGGWMDMSDNDAFIEQQLKNKAMTLRVVGILRPAENSALGSVSGQIGYPAALSTKLINEVNDSKLVKAQKADPDTDVFTGKPFAGTDAAEDISFDISTLSPEQQMYLSQMSEEQLAIMMEQWKASMVSTATYDGNLRKMGVSDLSNPSSIYLYAVDFDAKDVLEDLIKEYNQNAKDEDREEDVIRYTDYVGLMMSSVSTIINAISYILIAFVAISLVVSSIMIGIITYISVLERTKEIGILRSIGASKKDISRVFNAEAFIIGFCAGGIGIGITVLLNIPINAIIKHYANISGISALPWKGAIVLWAISILLTLIAGLIPSKMAAKKDPVVALRTE